jgi:hypothetical protein
MQRGQRAAIVPAILVAAACGGAPKPVDQLATSEAAIRAAQEAGAQQDPQGALHLKLAREQIDKAKGLIEEDDNEEANFLLLRAESDAELARSLAKKGAMERAAQQAVEAIEKVEEKP